MSTILTNNVYYKQNRVSINETGIVKDTQGYKLANTMLKKINLL